MDVLEILSTVFHMLEEHLLPCCIAEASAGMENRRVSFAFPLEVSETALVS